MAIAVRFSAEPTTREKYDEVRARLEQAGKWPAPDLVFHSAYGESEVEGVFEIWDSREAFEQFGATLMPLLEEIDINPGQPEVKEVYKLDQP